MAFFKQSLVVLILFSFPRPLNVGVPQALHLGLLSAPVLTPQVISSGHMALNAIIKMMTQSPQVRPFPMHHMVHFFMDRLRRGLW